MAQRYGCSLFKLLCSLIKVFAFQNFTSCAQVCSHFAYAAEDIFNSGIKTRSFKSTVVCMVARCLS